ncbi:hypothetical protein CCR90_14680 [Rhodovulum sulfidophilum]|nr:hypothetical protein [Rhodovulum sulfidophilum]ANB32856.1 hypothetical protein A6W98_01440 [Rhodovulum sulfidophilum DSM 1374]ANB36705.1 hypothetical protein A6024_01425 [Rhodovulum sulfidophilum]MBK5924987.1 hypothetical protein [Rhodovulum sulfidophilum]MCE8419877.1 hypothetical protein [Rhodovulum sulfidophilum]MCE8430420.1 hypothetical protein [Rhodovulum sulfidophilum]
MLLKVALLFLIGMAALGMFGKLRLPRPRGGLLPGRRRPAKCPHCGRFRIGRGPCPCGKG